MTDAVDHWQQSLPGWAIPARIIDQAPQSPWIHPVQSFRPDGDLHVDTPSRRRALEALPESGSVLDVGCGGGRAAFGLVPPATSVVGVDHQQGMLDVFSDEAARRGIACRTVLGDWPDVAPQAPRCDVVVCHHVFFNVADLRPFVEALHDHALRRVVVELPVHHPLSSLSPMWKHFWNLDRPTAPTAHDALAVVRSTGRDAQLEPFDVRTGVREVTEDDVTFTRIRLCLPPERDDEIREWIENHPVTVRNLATIWWDA